MEITDYAYFLACFPDPDTLEADVATVTLDEVAFEIYRLELIEDSEWCDRIDWAMHNPSNDWDD